MLHKILAVSKQRYICAAIFHLNQNIWAVAYENNDKKMESVYSKRIRAGKRRTYFFDVRATRGNDYYLTITESRKRFNDDGYDRHKIFLYKEDFNKFCKALGEAVDYVKTDLMPELVIVPRGLISVLLYYNLPQHLRLPGVETSLLFVVILGTSIIMSIGLFFYNRRVSGKEFENV